MITLCYLWQFNKRIFVIILVQPGSIHKKPINTDVFEARIPIGIQCFTNPKKTTAE